MRRLFLVALLVLVGRAAPAGSPVDDDAAERVLRLVAAQQIEAAAVETEAILRAHPDGAGALYLDATVKFQQGDYGGAVARFDEAIARAGDGADDRVAAQWRADRDLAAATAEATRGFVEARSPEGHFIVRYAPGKDSLLAPYAFATLEAARAAIAEHDFAATAGLGEPVRVEIYPRVSDLAKVSTLTIDEIETSGTIALCKFNRLMVVSPRALVHGYSWLDTLAHEYTHYVVTRTSKNNVPVWFHEGLAKFEERRWREAPDGAMPPPLENVLATALARVGKGGRLIGFDEMYPSMAKLPSQADTALAFAEVYTVVEYLYEKHGWPTVRAVIERMRDGKGDAGAVADVLGVGFEDFQRDWKAWLKKKNLRTHPGMASASLKFVKLDGDKASEGKDDDESDIGEDRARRFARLGGLLRAHKRLVAATVEYEKAQAILGPTNLPVSQKLARTYLDLRDAARAIAVGEPAFAVNSDAGGLAATLGAAWLARGEPGRAGPYLEAAIRINPFDPEPHCGLVKIYADRADPRAEREDMECKALVDNK